MNYHRNNIAALKIGIVLFTALCVATTFNWWAVIAWITAGVLISWYENWHQRRMLNQHVTALHRQMHTLLSELAANGQLPFDGRGTEFETPSPDSPESIVRNTLDKASRHDH